MTIYTHPALPYYVKHIEGKIFAHCDKNGELVKKKRTWSTRPAEQRHIISDRNKLIAVTTGDTKKFKV